MKKRTCTRPNSAPNPFVTHHQDDVIGVLSGLDRIRFKGTLPVLYQPKAMECFLSANRLLFSQFKDFATQLTQRIKASAMKLAEQAQRPFIYLKSCHTRKEAQARQLIERDQLTEGLVGIFGCVESCRTYFLVGNRQTRKLEFKLEKGRCQHFYFYHLHPEFGLMHLRLQSWFPFQVEVCLNGRHWLKRLMDRHQIEYIQKENCFPWIDQLSKAQRLMNGQLNRNWPKILDRILHKNHRLAREICRPLNLQYYWTTQESEYATDVMFRSPARLQQIYPSLVRHSITSFSSGDVMRFLGHRVCANGEVRGEFKGELVSDYKKRVEGSRVKHVIKKNSVKMYDKQRSVLRIETTINSPEDFRVFREGQDRPGQPLKDPGKKAWRPMRRGVVDLKRRAEVSRASNERYLSALSATTGKSPLKEKLDQLCKPVQRKGRRARALNLWSAKDRPLLEAVNRGEFKINGFRNRDLRELLCKGRVTDKERKQQAAKITRQLALLRTHGLIKKVPRTHRYLLTARGSEAITALLTAREANINELIAMAA